MDNQSEMQVGKSRQTGPGNHIDPHHHKTSMLDVASRAIVIEQGRSLLMAPKRWCCSSEGRQGARAGGVPWLRGHGLVQTQQKTPSGEVALPAPEHLEFVDDLRAAAVLLTTPTGARILRCCFMSAIVWAAWGRTGMKSPWSGQGYSVPSAAGDPEPGRGSSKIFVKEGISSKRAAAAAH